MFNYIQRSFKIQEVTCSCCGFECFSFGLPELVINEVFGDIYIFLNFSTSVRAYL